VTVFAGCVESTVVIVTLNPSACSCELAVLIGWPITLGTDTGVGPFETLMRTGEP
jgi:hypothetical protein